MDWSNCPQTENYSYEQGGYKYDVVDGVIWLTKKDGDVFHWDQEKQNYVYYSGVF